MKKTIFILLLLTVLAALTAQTTIPPNAIMPRAMVVRVVNADGEALGDEMDGLIEEVTFFDVTRDQDFIGFGFSRVRGDTYARINMGNFRKQWEEGDIVSLFVADTGTPAVMGRLEIPIPEGTGAVFWGRLPYEGHNFPGEPIRLLPCMLSIKSQDGKAYAILKDGKDSGYISGKAILPTNVKELPGKYSLGPAPKGMRWEPAEVELSLNDFTLQKRLDDDGSEHECYALELEFRLVEE